MTGNKSSERRNKMSVRTVLIALAMLAVSVSLRAADEPLAGSGAPHC